MTDFELREPRYAEIVAKIFHEAPFIRSLGAELVALAPGRCESRLELKAEHLQQDGFVHAGVEATLADHSAGCAAATLMAAGQRVLTAEFKINLLRAAHGDQLVCRAHVLRPGRTLTIAESEIFALDGSSEILAAKAMVTLALVS